VSFKLVHEVLRDLKLRWREKLILAVMASYADEEGSNVYPAVDRVAREAGVDTRTVQRALKQLREAGIIVLQMDENHRYGYTRNWVIDLGAAPRLPGHARPKRSDEEVHISEGRKAPTEGDQDGRRARKIDAAREAMTAGQPVTESPQPVTQSRQGVTSGPLNGDTPSPNSISEIRSVNRSDLILPDPPLNPETEDDLPALNASKHTTERFNSSALPSPILSRADILEVLQRPGDKEAMQRRREQRERRRRGQGV
jgi:hypothetical protein